jgi:hypothetical protein
MWWFGLFLLIVGLAGTALGLFLWKDQDGSVLSKEQGDKGLRMAVVSGIVIIISLVVFGYSAWQSFFSN